MTGESAIIKTCRHSCLSFWGKLLGRHEDSSLSSAAWRGVVAGFSIAYGMGARARRFIYCRRWLTVHRLPRPVISVGNLTVGGTGKTPVTASLARYFLAQGLKAAILSRGYGGRRRGVTRLSEGRHVYFKPPEVGEEAYWLARSLPGAAVYTAPSRYAAGLAAWQDLQPDLFLLDDGFQHFQLHRDLDIVLLDAESPFDNGRVLPRGRLREPASVLAAADVLILTRYEAHRHQAQLEGTKTRFPDKLILTAAISPTGARRFPGGGERPPVDLRGLPLLAFAGLARPRGFARSLEDLGIDLKAFRTFPDHYEYNDGDLASLVQEAARLKAPALITTSKDFARLGEKWLWELPLWVLEVEARVDWELLAPVWQRIFGE